MRFLSNGDFVFPLRASLYAADHLYMWSFARGAANPDGIMRLPGVLPDMLVFALFGNLAASYFYVLSSLLVAATAFFWFARSFLGVRQLGVQVWASLLFACNPIFLGNLSKIGLVLAAAMLPLCLTALQQAFARQRFRYFLLAAIGLNISLVHPFTFAVNTVMCAVYVALLVRRHHTFVRNHLGKLCAVLLIIIGLNAYFLLPLASLGSVSKDVLSNNITTTPVDYTSLVDVANTGDIFTGLSLAKGVFKDYEFFGRLTWPFYFLGVFALYAVLFGVYVKVERRAKGVDRRRVAIALGLFLLLLVLATATYLHVDVLIKFLIGLPGGWMFRSPLKWQLYIPLALCSALAVTLKQLPHGARLKFLYVALGAIFVLMNGYLFTQIYARLLTPKSFQLFRGVVAQPLERSNMLVVSARDCTQLQRDNSAVETELNQVMIAHNTQVKYASSGQVSSINLGLYSYVFSCRGAVPATTLTGQYNFVPVGTYAGGMYQLYKNRQALPYASATGLAFRLPSSQDVGEAAAFVVSNWQQPLVSLSESAKGPAAALADVLGDASRLSFAPGQITAPLSFGGHSDERRVFVNPTSQPLYYQLHGSQMQVSAEPAGGLRPLGHTLVLASSDQPQTVIYKDEAFLDRNLLSNPSFETGPWQKQVGDCNAYDDHPELSMSLDRQAKTDGVQSLRLSATQHIACTGPSAVPVQAGQQYCLRFDYQSDGGPSAGYFVGFDDTSGSSNNQRLADTNGQWQTFTQLLTAPPGATQLELMLYAYPDSATRGAGVAHYDHFQLIAMPPLSGKLVAVGGQTPSVSAPLVRSQAVNSTKNLLRIQAAREPFYLSTTEGYSASWQLLADSGKGGFRSFWPWAVQPVAALHDRSNGSFNGWYINPRTLCGSSPKACHRNADGSYDLQLAMEFAPQRWFYAGGFISIVSAGAAVIFVLLERRSDRPGGNHA
ncbi:MAG TPA: hypothetical protein VLF91_01255 [Candidatus Saccharimonadales bacterium]|nr:hypothetical protein [Candidatus Saccharimonadales bacterium]